MPKENRKFFLITCIITILPMFLGLFLWNRLPDQIATHFDLTVHRTDTAVKDLLSSVFMYSACLCTYSVP